MLKFSTALFHQLAANSLRQSLLIFLFFNLTFTAMYAQPPALSPFFSRTFQILYGKESGSSFLIQQKGSYYLVTAKHIVDTVVPQDIIITNDKGPIKLEGEKYLHPNKLVDVALFKLKNINVPGGALEISNHTVTIGDAGYFFGYPLGFFRTKGKNDIQEGFPMALVKRAGLSGLYSEDGSLIYFLDGINNRGFSGGPVVFVNQKTHQLEVVGVISGYWPESGTVTNKKKEGYPDAFYETNTGIIKSFGTIHVQEIIDSIK